MGLSHIHTHVFEEFAVFQCKVLVQRSILILFLCSRKYVVKSHLNRRKQALLVSFTMHVRITTDCKYRGLGVFPCEEKANITG